MDAAYTPTSLYETDYAQWIETTVAKLRAQDYAEVDWPHLIEEVEDMGWSERRSLKSNLIVLLVHLLKWQFQPDRRTGSWAGTIVEHRRRIRDAISESPSLHPYFEQILAESYAAAVKQASAETQLPRSRFPDSCPYSPSVVLDDEA